MAAFQDHTLLYDEDCPLCQAYTSAFIKTGMLDKNGRTPFYAIRKEWAQHVDLIKARHEIAFINTKSGEVWYGAKGLVKILGAYFPFVPFFYRFTLIQLLVNQLYAFISYNRKVIMPFRKSYATPSCAPDYHHGYRVAYVLFSGFLTALLLHGAGIQHDWYRANMPAFAEFWIVPLQWIVQLFVLKPATKEEAVTYLGQLQTASLLASAMLIPPAIWASYGSHIAQGVFGISWFFAVVWLFFHYRRRMKLLHFPTRMTYGWIGFRILLVITLTLINL